MPNTQQAVRYASFLHRLKCLLSALDDELHGHAEAIVRWQLPAVEQRLANEQRLCGELSKLVGEMRAEAAEIGPETVTALVQDQQPLFQGLENARRALSATLRIHDSLIRKVLRSVRVLSNTLSYGNSYLPSN
jgi:hypothetical protein